MEWHYFPGKFRFRDKVLRDEDIRRAAIEAAGTEKESLLCYSIVNSLCLNSGMKRVCFFFEGEQAETIAGSLYWGGEFMYNPGM